jgi:hypothetical protein
LKGSLEFQYCICKVSASKSVSCRDHPIFRTRLLNTRVSRYFHLIWHTTDKIYCAIVYDIHIHICIWKSKSSLYTLAYYNFISFSPSLN